MKILASDYDGTLCLDGTVTQTTKKALERWKAAGHLFGIVTGRDIRMTRDVITEHGLTVDFTICNNGCVIYDGNLKEVHSNHLPPDIVNELIHCEMLKRSSYIVLADQQGRYVYDDHYDPKRYPHPKVYHTAVLTQRDITKDSRFYQMDTRYQTAEEMHEISTLLEKTFQDRITINPNVDTIDLTPIGVTKCTGLMRCAQINGWQQGQVITVGDGFNDLPMLLHYKGYAMETAVEEIKNQVGKTVAAVEELIDLELKR